MSSAVAASPVVLSLEYRWLRPDGQDRTHLYAIGATYSGANPSVCRKTVLEMSPDRAKPPKAGLRCATCARYARNRDLL